MCNYVTVLLSQVWQIPRNHFNHWSTTKLWRKCSFTRVPKRWSIYPLLAIVIQSRLSKDVENVRWFPPSVDFHSSEPSRTGRTLELRVPYRHSCKEISRINPVKRNIVFLWNPPQSTCVRRTRWSGGVTPSQPTRPYAVFRRRGWGRGGKIIYNVWGEKQARERSYWAGKRGVLLHFRNWNWTIWPCTLWVEYIFNQTE